MIKINIKLNKFIKIKAVFVLLYMLKMTDAMHTAGRVHT